MLGVFGTTVLQPMFLFSSSLLSTEVKSSFQVTYMYRQNKVLNFQTPPPPLKNQRLLSIFVQKNDFWTRFKHETIQISTFHWCSNRHEKQYLHTLRLTSWKKKVKKVLILYIVFMFFGKKTKIFFQVNIEKNFNFKNFAEIRLLDRLGNRTHYFEV